MPNEKKVEETKSTEKKVEEKIAPKKPTTTEKAPPPPSPVAPTTEKTKEIEVVDAEEVKPKVVEKAEKDGTLKSAKKQKSVKKGTVVSIARNMLGGKTLTFKEDVSDMKVSNDFVEANKIKKGSKVALPK